MWPTVSRVLVASGKVSPTNQGSECNWIDIEPDPRSRAPSPSLCKAFLALSLNP